MSRGRELQVAHYDELASRVGFPRSVLTFLGGNQVRNLIGTLASVVLVVGVAAAAWSSEADELRAKAKTLQRQAEQLSQEGRRDEADKLAREAKELFQAAQKHDQREPNERKAGSKPTGKHTPELPEALTDAGRRIKHIHIAVENLHAAGLHDVADELSERAEGMQRELQQAHEQFAKEQQASEKRKQPEAGQKHFDSDRKHVPPVAPDDELRHELKRLRVELNELREEIKKRP